MNALSSYTPEELAEYEKAESIREQAPGLFSLSPKWFKFSDYEILDTKKGLYIAPIKNSLKILYEPFKLFPEILQDYLQLLIDLKSLQELNADKNCSEDEVIRMFKKLDFKRAETILPFVRKYGLLGLFNDCLLSIEPDFNDDTGEKHIAVLSHNSRFYLSSFYQTNAVNFSVEYEKLASHFLPRLCSPYPNIYESKAESKIFHENYAERINDIMLYPDITRILRHQKLLKEYESTGSNPDSIVESFCQENTRSHTTYKRALGLGFNDLGIAFSYDNEAWDIRWNFKSLFSALSIMYAMNIAGKMGPKIQLCQYSKCNKITLGKKYCCPQHADAARQERCRANKKKREGVNNGDDSEAR